MTPATIIAIIQALAAFMPQIPELITAVETAVGLLKSGAPPTDEQIASINAALNAANAAVQSA